MAKVKEVRDLAHHVWPVETLAHAVQVVGARASHNEVVRDNGRSDEVEGRYEGGVVLLQPCHNRLHEVRTESAQQQPAKKGLYPSHIIKPYYSPFLTHCYHK